MTIVSAGFSPADALKKYQIAPRLSIDGGDREGVQHKNAATLFGAALLIRLHRSLLMRTSAPTGIDSFHQ
jgi:hypothetical protein